MLDHVQYSTTRAEAGHPVANHGFTTRSVKVGDCHRLKDSARVSKPLLCTRLEVADVASLGAELLLPISVVRITADDDDHPVAAGSQRVSGDGSR
jgi:hypothetical protein